MNFDKLDYFIAECFLPSFLSGACFFVCLFFYLYYTARMSILSQLLRQSAGYVFLLFQSYCASSVSTVAIFRQSAGYILIFDQC